MSREPLHPGEELTTGARHYRAFIGRAEKYDVVSAMQFNLLVFLGLREHHSLLDIGCGSLRGGKLFLPYLLPQRYFGIEPERWLLEEGIKHEIGDDLIRLKSPTFRHDADFALSAFDRTFDFILAQSIFSHASEAQITRCLSEASKVMTDGSFFAATYVRGEENYTGSEWVYPGCITYTPDHMSHLAAQHGLSCVALDWPHPNRQTWIVLVKPANEPNVPRPGDPQRLAALDGEITFLRERLETLEAHPYVKLGLGVRRFAQRLRQRISNRT